jgi:putative tryptophan/tyrosine transport system substrate-binding protein
MKRRGFITLLGGAVAWPAMTWSQPGVRRVGLLSSAHQADRQLQTRVLGFSDGLRRLGWIEGQNVRIDYRYGGADEERLMTAARELVALAPEVIVAHANPSVVALRYIDRRIPTVMVQVGDPVRSGFIESLARPGGNLTGFLTFEAAMGGKWLELIKEVSPGTARVLALVDPKITANAEFLRATEAAASPMHISVTSAAVQTESEISAAMISFGKERNGGVIAMPNPTNSHHRRLIAELGAQHRLPTVIPFQTWMDGGALISYGVDEVDLFRKAADYVDRILRGAKPSELPVQAPTKFELVINLKTAKTLGLNIPPTLLARADEVIE